MIRRPPARWRWDPPHIRSTRILCRSGIERILAVARWQDGKWRWCLCRGLLHDIGGVWTGEFSGADVDRKAAERAAAKAVRREVKAHESEKP